MKEYLYDFEPQLKIGKKGESHFLRDYANLNPRQSTIYAVDFYLPDFSVELKTDTWLLSDSPNFFMEREVDGKTAGPWRAAKDNIDLFIYYFIKERTYFWFSVEELVSTLNDIIIRYDPPQRNIPNKRWNGFGYLIRRDYVNPIIMRQERFQ